MIKRYLRYILLFGWALAWSMAVQAAPARASSPVVHAVLFYSPTCPHCHDVIQNDLPPLLEQYGQQLEIIGVDTSQPQGQALYQAAVEHFDVPANRRGVPTLVVNDVVLVGSGEIPQLFPGLIEEYLAQDGVDWPEIPGLREAMTAQAEAEAVSEATPVSPAAVPDQPAAGAETDPMADPGAAPTPAAAARPAEAPPEAAPAVEAGLVNFDTQPVVEQPASVWARVGRDPLGNGLAIVVLVGMVLMVGYTGITLWQAPEQHLPAWRTWAVPLLCPVGLGVAAYLSYVETADVPAVCGPVGDCNTVQQSPYARLFGVVPIGMLGLVGYLAIFATWAIGSIAKGTLADLAWLALFLMALSGTLFSIYLTFLEPFVIGATCAWCLTSAVLMTALLWLALAPAQRALARLLH